MSPKPPDISLTQPSRGDDATIIGFGADSIRPSQDDTSVGTKKNRPSKIDKSLDSSTSAVLLAQTAQPTVEQITLANSGGPMIVDSEIVVTLVASLALPYVNVNSSGSRNFIDSVENELGFEIN